MRGILSKGGWGEGDLLRGARVREKSLRGAGGEG